MEPASRRELDLFADHLRDWINSMVRLYDGIREEREGKGTLTKYLYARDTLKEIQQNMARKSTILASGVVVYEDGQ